MLLSKKIKASPKILVSTFPSIILQSSKIIEINLSHPLKLFLIRKRKNKKKRKELELMLKNNYLSLLTPSVPSKKEISINIIRENPE